MTDEPADDAVSHFSGYVREFDAHYRERDEFRERLAIWHELLDRHATPGGRAIDLGCGTGIFSFYLAEKGGTVTGVDGAPDMVAFCEAERARRGLTNLRFMQARLPDVDEPALGRANLLISSSVIEYVPDLDRTLALFSRLLEPGGTLIVSMPNLWCVNRIYERLKYKVKGEPHIYKHIVHFTTPKRLAGRLRPLGFTQLDERYYTHFTRLAKLTRKIGLPETVTEDLFVVVLRKA